MASSEESKNTATASSTEPTPSSDQPTTAKNGNLELEDVSKHQPPMPPALAQMLIAALTKRKGWKEIWDGCPHKAALNTDEPCVPCQTEAYEAAKAAYEFLRGERGLDDVLTLFAAFDLQYCLITSYRLSECDELLTAVYDACKRRGKDDYFYIQEVQALAFLRYKQARYEESCELFEEMQQIVGDNERLLENMGHTYTSIGKVEKAEECFQRALAVIDSKETQIRQLAAQLNSSEEEIQEELKAYNRAGILLGLGMCRKAQGKLDAALSALLDSLALYKAQHAAGDHSICAKVAGHVGDCLCEMGREKEAEGYYRDAVRIFRVTCGESSPLTVNALQKLGDFLMKMMKFAEAESIMMEALQRSLEMDLHSLRLKSFVELLASLTTIASGQGALLASAATRASGAPAEEYKQKTPAEMTAFAKKLVAICKAADLKFRKLGVLPVLQKPASADAKAAEDEDKAESAKLHCWVFYKVFAEQCLAAGLSPDEARDMMDLPGPLAVPRSVARSWEQKESS